MDRNESTDISENADSRVYGVTSDGHAFSGYVTHFTPDSIVFKVCALYDVLRSTEVITDFHANLGGREVYSGRAVIRGFVDEGVTQVCEAVLEPGWAKRESEAWLDDSLGFKRKCDDFQKRWNYYCKVLPEFKLLVTDIRIFLDEFRLWLDTLNLGLNAVYGPDRDRMESGVVAELGVSFIPSFNLMFEKFEVIASKIPAELAPNHHAHVKQQLHHLVLSSPFAWRTFTKPLGYAGDYEMVNMILRDPAEGATLFAKVLNAWFISQPPAEAHRNRVSFLTRKLEEESIRVMAEKRGLKVLNLGCGPAIEVQRFLESSMLSEQAMMTLLDFNDKTLEYTKGVIEECKRRYRRSTSFEFVKKSVVQLLKTNERGKSYDLVYCAGLFDYLPERICRQLTSAFYGMLAPGGLLVLTNVDKCNPIRQMLDYLLEWHLIYRNAMQLRALAPAEISDDNIRVSADPTGVNIYLEIRRQAVLKEAYS